MWTFLCFEKKPYCIETIGSNTIGSKHLKRRQCRNNPYACFLLRSQFFIDLHVVPKFFSVELKRISKNVLEINSGRDRKILQICLFIASIRTLRWILGCIDYKCKNQRVPTKSSDTTYLNEAGLLLLCSSCLRSSAIPGRWGTVHSSPFSLSFSEMLSPATPLTCPEVYHQPYLSPFLPFSYCH